MKNLLDENRINQIRYIAESEKLPLNFVEENMYKHALESTKFTNSDVQRVLNEIYEIYEKSNLFLETINKKKMQLYNELLHSLKTGNYIWISDGLRTFLEVLGSEAYFSHKIYEFTKRIDNSRSIINIENTLADVKTHIDKMLITTAIKDFKLPNVNYKQFAKQNLKTKTLIESYCSYFDEKYAEIKNDIVYFYMYLSEIVHPSLGSTLLASATSIEELSYYDLANPHKYKKLQENNVQYTRNFYAVVNDMLMVITTPPPNSEVEKIHLTFIYRYISQAAKNPSISFSELFRLDPKDKLRVLGDGRSAETAYHVINALSEEEEFVNLAEIINRRQLTNRMTDYLNMKDYLYEKHFDQNNDEVWFKYNLKFVNERAQKVLNELQ